MLADRESGELGETTLEEQWMLKYSMAVPIKLVGVWDTVGALGIPAFSIQGISRSTLGFLHTGLRLSIDNCFHALAIDEHRRALRQPFGRNERPTIRTSKRLQTGRCPVLNRDGLSEPMQTSGAVMKVICSLSFLSGG